MSASQQVNYFPYWRKPDLVTHHRSIIIVLHHQTSVWTLVSSTECHIILSILYFTSLGLGWRFSKAINGQLVCRWGKYNTHFMGINFPVFSSEMYLKRVYISTVFLPIWLVGLGVGMKAPISAEFIANFLKWQFPLKANIYTNVGQCFTLNFGSQLNIEDLPMTTIDPYLVDQQIFQQNKTESDATNNCFLVFIGG